MSEQSKLIDPAGRCVHARIERVVSGITHAYTNEWRCVDCREQFFDLDLAKSVAELQDNLRSISGQVPGRER